MSIATECICGNSAYFCDGTDGCFHKQKTMSEQKEKSAGQILDDKDLHWMYAPGGDNSKPLLHDRDCTFCRIEDRVLEAIEEYGNQFKSQIETLEKEKDKYRSALSNIAAQHNSGNLVAYNGNFIYITEYAKLILASEALKK